MKGNDMPIRHSTIKRRRIRTVIDNLILLAGHLTDNARKLRLARDIAMAGFIPFSESLHHFEFCGIRYNIVREQLHPAQGRA